MAADDADSPLAAVHALLAGVTLDDYLAARPPTAVVTVSDAMPLEQVWVVGRGGGGGGGGGRAREGAERQPRLPPFQVLRLFASRDILSAPVFAAGTDTCRGFVGVDDILRAMLGWASVAADPSPAGRAEGLRRAGARLHSERVRDIPRANDGALLRARADGSMSLLEVVRSAFLRNGAARPVHRIAVYDAPDGDDDDADDAAAGAPVRVTAVVSQSDVVAFIARHSPAGLGPLARIPVGDIEDLVSSPVAAVPQDMSAALALASLFQSDCPVSAAAVVATQGAGTHGALLADVSLADLRGLTPADVGALATPVLDFLATRHPPPARSPTGAASAWGVKAPDAERRRDVAAAKFPPGAPLGSVVAALAASRRHRVYIVDGDGRPDGILTLTDLLKLIARPA